MERGTEPEEYKIFVGGISRDIEDFEFFEAFKEFGDIMTWSLVQGRGFGFVSYRRKEEAENAISVMDGRYLENQRIGVEWADGWPVVPREETSYDYESVFNRACADNRSVHCKGLKSHTTVETLKTIFSPFGEIEDIDLYTHYSDFAFIHFNSKEAAALAICSINNTEIDGSLVKCNWSHRPNYRGDRSTVAVTQTTSSESSSVPSRSSSPSIEYEDEFERIFNETTSNNRTVYCGGLTSAITEEYIREIFSPFGIIESITLFVERSDYGFIRFNTKEAATLAICSVDGTIINGERVKCSWSHRADSYSPEPPSSPLESSPEPSETLSQTLDMLHSLCSQLRLGVAGAAAAAAPLTEDLAPESQEAAKPKEKKPDLLCKICMDEELGIVFLPCGHLVACAKCAQKIASCPLCRKTITKKVRTYLS